MLSQWTVRPCCASLLGSLPRPSIWAKPDSVIPWGWPVTNVCRGPAGVKVFHLDMEQDRNPFTSQFDPHETEARLPITVVSGDTAQHFRCLC